MDIPNSDELRSPEVSRIHSDSPPKDFAKPGDFSFIENNLNIEDYIEKLSIAYTIIDKTTNGWDVIKSDTDNQEYRNLIDKIKKSIDVNDRVWNNILADMVIISNYGWKTYVRVTIKEQEDAKKHEVTMQERILEEQLPTYIPQQELPPQGESLDGLKPKSKCSKQSKCSKKGCTISEGKTRKAHIKKQKTRRTRSHKRPNKKR
jgi:hypothetical protein